MWPIRSYLFVPAHRPEWVAKAVRTGTEAVILDVEDAVPPAGKPQARAALRDELAELARAGVGGFVRINGLDEGGLEDIPHAVHPGLTGVIVPKAASAAQVRAVADAVSFCEGRSGMPHNGVAVMPLPETPEGMWDVHELATASARVKGIMGALGGETEGDVARAAGFRPTLGGLEQLFLNSRNVLASRAAGAIYPCAGIIGTRIDDLSVNEALIHRAKEIGYTGVALIHPSHVAIANRVFRPSAEEVAYFRGLLAAFAEAEAAGIGAVKYDGRMVDYAMLPIARAVVAEADRAAARQS
jgi:citrate lyase subunit beta/citryl-CoA lyase